MSSMNLNGIDQDYWRSLQELADEPEFRRFLEGEFPEPAEVPTDAMSRRRFLQVMGASVAMASLVGCRWPQETIVPFASRPEGVTPGTARRYATVMELAGAVGPLLVTSFDGRPIKVEGNPDHPLSQGACDLFAQAGLLELYDPDRSRFVLEREGGHPRRRSHGEGETAAAAAFAALRARRGAGLAVLTEATSSPTFAALRARVRDELPEAAWYEYEPVSRDNERLGTGLAFGEARRVRVDVGKARVLACFDADLLLDHPTALRNARDFAGGRRAEDGAMNRLYAVESEMSLTGGMADHRVAVPSLEIPHALYGLAAELVLGRGLALPSGYEAVLPALEHARAAGHAPAWMGALAGDLLAHRGESLIAVGPRQPDHAHVLAILLNEALGNTGRTVSYGPDDQRGLSHGAAIATLAVAMGKGQVESLLILGGNPVHDAPADLDFGGLLDQVAESWHLSLFIDETSQRSRWHLPRAHWLESWHDVRDHDGRYAVAQPLIAPLYDGRTPAELLSLLLDGVLRPAHDLVRATAAGQPGAGDWEALLHRGFADAMPAEAPAVLDGRGVVAAVRRGGMAKPPAIGRENLELVFVRDPSLHDGRFANNAWLQELPDFMTKLSWDNAALFGVSTAEALGVAHGDLVELELGGRRLEAAVYVLPGHAPWSVSLSLGHGRTAAGNVGNGTGFRAYALRASAAPDAGAGLKVARTGRSYPLATTQDHHAIDAVGMREREKRSRSLVVSGTLAEYREHPEFASHRTHHPPLVSLWQERPREGHAWGMTVDLSTCIGCNACVVACQAENNIPVVGKEQVGKGREMHWLRLDRYFQGDPDAPAVAHQPVACVHCELAPCEQVCPVGATMHSEDGLNVMAYNRCVGTRYCSNNCPYKVRRFNWFNFNSDIPDVRKMVYNPEVSLRARGVMEKCTYCVQRIETAKIDAKNEGRPVRDGEVVTACQQTCPTQAIAFGDLNDPQSRVAKLTTGDRAYHLLAELNVKPRTAYLARLRNPNPELAESADGHPAH